MTDRELNKGLAKALGWDVYTDPSPYYTSWYGTNDNAIVLVQDFSPSTSVDALRKWVLPELERRGLRLDFEFELASMPIWTGPEDAVDTVWNVLTVDPSVLAAAALAVLEADNG